MKLPCPPAPTLMSRENVQHAGRVAIKLADLSTCAGVLLVVQIQHEQLLPFLAGHVQDAVVGVDVADAGEVIDGRVLADVCIVDPSKDTAAGILGRRYQDQILHRRRRIILEQMEGRFGEQVGIDGCLRRLVPEHESLLVLVGADEEHRTVGPAVVDRDARPGRPASGRPQQCAGGEDDAGGIDLVNASVVVDILHAEVGAPRRRGAVPIVVGVLQQHPVVGHPSVGVEGEGSDAPAVVAAGKVDDVDPSTVGEGEGRPALGILLEVELGFAAVGVRDQRVCLGHEGGDEAGGQEEAVVLDGQVAGAVGEGYRLRRLTEIVVGAGRRGERR
mmetsp:Transcript_6935/g.16535  ORF Transcript_6935/g.16535 Transcript_6935/m.16535 type:complete len:331 (-) Transcript_6935:544-1536(-)